MKAPRNVRKENLVCLLAMMRHAETTYRPDVGCITAKGRQQSKLAASQIQEVVAGFDLPYNIFTSTKAWGAQTGEIVRFALGTPNQIRLESDIRSVDIHDETAAREIIKKHRARGAHHLDLAYLTSSEFDNSRIFEPRVNIRERVQRFILETVMRTLRSTQPCCKIAVTHFECMWPVAERMFNLNPTIHTLDFGECLYLWFSKSPLPDSLLVDAQFKGRTVGNLHLDTTNGEIVQLSADIFDREFAERT